MWLKVDGFVERVGLW
jgi:hypothetical protein